ncbi:hypothetical protein HAP94_02185 [Acidithiobacillus ferrivorans]|nr:hypothetical protein [Acidithiobacillus ferrivorans]
MLMMVLADFFIVLLPGIFLSGAPLIPGAVSAALMYYANTSPGSGVPPPLAAGEAFVTFIVLAPGLLVWMEILGALWSGLTSIILSLGRRANESLRKALGNLTAAQFSIMEIARAYYLRVYGGFRMSSTFHILRMLTGFCGVGMILAWCAANAVAGWTHPAAYLSRKSIPYAPMLSMGVTLILIVLCLFAYADAYLPSGNRAKWLVRITEPLFHGDKAAFLQSCREHFGWEPRLSYWVMPTFLGWVGILGYCTVMLISVAITASGSLGIVWAHTQIGAFAQIVRIGALALVALSATELLVSLLCFHPFWSISKRRGNRYFPLQIMMRDLDLATRGR